MMSKNELHELIQKDITEITQMQKSVDTAKATVYQIAIDHLKKIDGTIFIDVPRNERDTLSKSCSGFNTKELSIVAPKVGKLLSKVNYNYAQVFDLIDPDIAKLLKGN